MFLIRFQWLFKLTILKKKKQYQASYLLNVLHNCADINHLHVLICITLFTLVQISNID